MDNNLSAHTDVLSQLIETVEKRLGNLNGYEGCHVRLLSSSDDSPLNWSQFPEGIPESLRSWLENAITAARANICGDPEKTRQLFANPIGMLFDLSPPPDEVRAVLGAEPKFTGKATRPMHKVRFGHQRALPAAKTATENVFATDQYDLCLQLSLARILALMKQEVLGPLQSALATVPFSYLIPGADTSSQTGALLTANPQLAISLDSISGEHCYLTLSLDIQSVRIDSSPVAALLNETISSRVPPHATEPGNTLVNLPVGGGPLNIPIPALSILEQTASGTLSKELKPLVGALPPSPPTDGKAIELKLRLKPRISEGLLRWTLVESAWGKFPALQSIPIPIPSGGDQGLARQRLIEAVKLEMLHRATALFPITKAMASSASGTGGIFPRASELKFLSAGQGTGDALGVFLTLTNEPTSKVPASLSGYTTSAVPAGQQAQAILGPYFVLQFLWTAMLQAGVLRGTGEPTLDIRPREIRYGVRNQTIDLGTESLQNATVEIVLSADLQNGTFLSLNISGMEQLAFSTTPAKVPAVQLLLNLVAPVRLDLDSTGISPRSLTPFVGVTLGIAPNLIAILVLLGAAGVAPPFAVVVAEMAVGFAVVAAGAIADLCSKLLGGAARELLGGLTPIEVLPLDLSGNLGPLTLSKPVKIDRGLLLDTARDTIVRAPLTSGLSVKIQAPFLGKSLGLFSVETYNYAHLVVLTAAQAHQIVRTNGATGPLWHGEQVFIVTEQPESNQRNHLGVFTDARLYYWTPDWNTSVTWIICKNDPTDPKIYIGDAIYFVNQRYSPQVMKPQDNNEWLTSAADDMAKFIWITAT